MLASVFGKHVLNSDVICFVSSLYACLALLWLKIILNFRAELGLSSEKVRFISLARLRLGASEHFKLDQTRQNLSNFNISVLL